MGTSPTPALFVSHGAPSLVIEDVPARSFLARLGPSLGPLKAILAVSAHWETESPTASAAQLPATIHDFGGFPAELYAMRYPAPGAPWLADRVAALLEDAGLRAYVDPERGLDHGAWVPLKLMLPEAAVPATQLSIQPQLGPAHAHRVGQALRPLRDEGVLVLASGSATHDLRAVFGHSLAAATPDWVSRFADWVADAVEGGRTDALLRYRDLAPNARRNHPTEEHLLPLFTALGAGTPGVPGKRIHASTTYGALAMDAYAFA